MSTAARAQIALPGIPGLPALPPLTLPAIPGLPSSLPTIPIPSAPALPTVSAPNTTGLSSTGDKPKYPARENVFSFPDIRLEKLPEARVPFLEVMHVPSFKTYQSHREACQKAEVKGDPPNPTDCPQYEWSVPYSPESASQDAARDLRLAWQRFEDRYYWNTMVRLNNPAFYVAFCSFNVGRGLNPATPDVTVHLPDQLVEPSLRQAIPSSQPVTNLNLDNYRPFPQVDNQDFCDDLNLNLQIMFVPGLCLAIGGLDVICTPNFPKPIWFNTNEAINRVATSILHAHTTYLAEYQADAIKALTPGVHTLFPLPWRSNAPGDGAFIAPVMNTDLNPQQFTDLGSRAKSALGGLVGANATAYYLQSVLRLPSLSLLTGDTTGTTVSDTPSDSDGDRPGIWKLEEFKRLLKPSNPAFMEHIGYASFFEAWNELTVTVLPEPTYAKALRPIVYWAVGIRLNIDPNTCGICPIPVPYPVPVAPFLLPFAGPQMKWGWTSVPEGYEIPRVKGTPLFDYRPLLRTTGGK